MNSGNIDKRDESLSIKEIQKYLRALSNFGVIQIPNLIIDGVFGQRTRDAVRTFQRDMGIPVTGIVDLLTWNILYEEYLIVMEKSKISEGIFPFEEKTLSQLVQLGDNSVLVYIIQLILHTLGIEYDLEQQDITGEYNEQTKRNVARFQEANGLSVSGNVDKLTWNALAKRFNEAIYKD